MDEAMVLAIFLDEEGLDTAVNLNELPQFVEDGLIESQSKRDLLEDLGWRTRDQKDVRVDLCDSDCSLRIEGIIENWDTLVNLFTKDRTK